MPQRTVEKETGVAQRNIPAEVQRFVADHITSADQLDILLLLYGHPEREWTARQVSESVFTVPASAIMRLEQLVANRLLTSTGGTDPAYRYGPATSALATQVDALAAAYRADRVGVIQLVFQAPKDPLQAFSDAFRLKRED